MRGIYRNIFQWVIWLCLLWQGSVLCQQPMALSEKKVAVQQAVNYIRRELHLNIPSDFYAKYQPSTRLNYYLYIAQKDSVKGVFKSPFEYFGFDVEAAKVKQQHYDSMGYSTLLYRTAGTSAALLSDSLLSYDLESILFIVFHEATHNHLRQSGVPYIYEEAACDIIGNYASMRFIAQHYPQSIQASKIHLNNNERVFEVLNRATYELSNKAENTVMNFDPLQKQLEKLLVQFGAFQRDRYHYSINTAYLMRYESYSKYYFDLKKLYLAHPIEKYFLDHLKQYATR